MQQPVLIVSHLRKDFNGRTVLKDISFQLRNHERLTIIGPSGCGKSVLLRTIAGLELPEPSSSIAFSTSFTFSQSPLDSNLTAISQSSQDRKTEKLSSEAQRSNNKIKNNNKNSGNAQQDTFDEISQLPIIKRAKFTKIFSMLFQGDALFDSMDVFANIAFPLLYNLRLKDHQKIRDLVFQCLTDVELEHSVTKKYPSELSGGMRKRVAIARAIITRPHIIFLDEPTAGLDPLTATKISKLILKLNEATHNSMIIVTHDKHCLSIVSERNIVMDDGAIIAEGNIDQLAALSASNEFLSAFFC